MTINLRGRVGKHTSAGRQCQNWKSDQQIIIGLLNLVPYEDGGAAGSLSMTVIGGIVSKPLYEAITAFEHKHFFGSRKGYVDPGGAMLAKLEMLASRQPPEPAQPKPPRKPNQWDKVQASSVTKPLRTSLLDDGKLDYDEVINIIRSTLSDGALSVEEVTGLKEIAKTSRSISPASKLMLETMGAMMDMTPGGKGPYELPTEQHRFAAEMACQFLAGRGPRRFPNLSRYEVGIGLLMRIGHPGLINQKAIGVCGPAAFLYSVAAKKPIQYARYAIDLFEKGKARIEKLVITPGVDCRNFRPPADMPDADWLTMASLRDSENWFFDVDTVPSGWVSEKASGFATGTRIGEIEGWLRDAGFSDIREESSAIIDRDEETIDTVNALYQKGYRVILRINAGMLIMKEQNEGSIRANHFVAMASPIERANGKIRATFFTWGQGYWPVPAKGTELSVADFLNNFYGYVAARP